MLSVDADALMCDLAETYHIFDYRLLPCKTVAALSCGLRNDSRIKMKMAGVKGTTTEILLAAVVDKLSSLLWQKSRDGMHGVNKPKSILSAFFPGCEEKDEDICTFATGEEFKAQWDKIVGKEG